MCVLLTREEQPQLSSHALRDSLKNKLFRLLCAVHANSLSEFCKVVLPCLLLQELFRLDKRGKTKDKRTTSSLFNFPIKCSGVKAQRKVKNVMGYYNERQHAWQDINSSTKCKLIHQFGIELLRWTAAVHGHEGFCCRGHAAVVQVERAFSFWAQTVLWTAGEQGSMLGVNLETHHIQDLMSTFGHKLDTWRVFRLC